MRSSDWSSDVCSSDLFEEQLPKPPPLRAKTRGPFERSENPHRTSTSLGLAPRLRSGRRKWDSSLSQTDAEPSPMPSPPPSEHKRPLPDALLRQAKRAARGRLKIFLGAAPGVGKTARKSVG